MSHSPQLVPAGLPKLLSDARDCMARNDHPQALQLLQRAKGLDPQNDKVFLELGRVHAITYDFASAECCFEAAIRVSASKVNAILTVGHHWMDVRNFEAATNYFEKALGFEPVPLVAFARLAEMYSRLRRLDAADAITERALREYPGNEGALLARGVVLRQKRQYEQAELLLLQVTSNAAAPADARAAAGYELAGIYDAQERYDDAMKACLEAKAFLRERAIPLMKTSREKLAHMREMATSITEKTLQRWRQVGQSDLQPPRRLALLCGFPRSGTTMLEYVLDSHPEVVSADETAVFQNKAYFEISRNLAPGIKFSSVLDSMSPRTLRQVRAEYLRGVESYLGQPIGNRLLLDKNPSMTFDVPGMTRIFPESKFLVALRDPRDVCLSCFMQAWPVLPDTAPWLSLDGMVDSYAAVMAFWLSIRPAIGSSAIEVRYEDMVENLELNARRTLDFLGLAWHDGVLRFNETAQKKIVRSPTYVEVTKPVYKTSVGRWRNYQKYFEPRFKKLEPFLKAFGYAAVMFFCAIRSTGMWMILAFLMISSVVRGAGSDLDRLRVSRRASESTRKTVMRTDSVRVIRRAEAGC